jgi:hypothetical protein
MIFAVPIIGKILAGFAASEASASASTSQKIGAAKIQPSGAAADPADFAQTLDTVGQTAASKAQHSVFGPAKI